MARSKSRYSQLKELIGEYVRLFFKINNDPVSLSSEVKMVISGVEGYVIDITENYLFLGNSLEEGYSVVVELENIFMFEIIDPDETIDLLSEVDLKDIH